MLPGHQVQFPGRRTEEVVVPVNELDDSGVKLALPSLHILNSDPDDIDLVLPGMTIITRKLARADAS